MRRKRGGALTSGRPNTSIADAASRWSRSLMVSGSPVAGAGSSSGCDGGGGWGFFRAGRGRSSGSMKGVRWEGGSSNSSGSDRCEGGASGGERRVPGECETGGRGVCAGGGVMREGSGKRGACGGDLRNWRREEEEEIEGEYGREWGGEREGKWNKMKIFSSVHLTGYPVCLVQNALQWQGQSPLLFSRVSLKWADSESAFFFKRG